jgi:serine phosphatase RsbU (regulator of sigma subunit)
LAPEEAGRRSEASGSEIWRLATALSGAATPLDVAIALAKEGAAAAAADFSNMAVCDDGRTWVIHGASLDSALADRWSNLSDNVATPLNDAIALAKPVLLSTFEQITTAYPALTVDTAKAGLVATASLPLLTADGNAAGAAGFGWATEQRFDQEQVRLLDLITQMASSALERAVLHQRILDNTRQRERADAQLLQDIFLPRTLPVVERLDMAAVYLPASDAAMGGDWYDVFTVSAGTTFVIGDVAGHGLQAAAVMAQLRNAVRAYAVEHASPAEVMIRLNRMLCELEPTETATAIVVAWDPQLGVIVHANAGHPPILRCRPGETAYLASPAADLLLGVQPAWKYRTQEKQLRPGTTLLFYTDGLIEQRGAALDEGMEALRGLVDSLNDLAPRSVCDVVLGWRLDRGPREDDICLLAVRLA